MEDAGSRRYYRDGIKCLLFIPKFRLKRVCDMVKNGAHIILKIKKRKVPQIFYFFNSGVG